MDKKYGTIERATAAAGLVALAAGGLIVALFDPSRAGFFPGCPLLELTGFACPGCGLTRGFHALFHGHILEALDFNLLLPFFAIGFFYLALLLASLALRGRALSFTIVTPASLWVFLITAALFGIARNIPGYPFEILFP